MPSSPITFDLTGSVPNAYFMSFEQSAISLTVSSALYYGGATGSQLPYEFSTPTLSMTSDGIGALNTYNDLGIRLMRMANTKWQHFRSAKPFALPL